MKQIHDFAVSHPKEVIILAIGELLEMTCDGNIGQMSAYTINQLHKEIDNYLGEVLTYGSLNNCYRLRDFYNMRRNV